VEGKINVFLVTDNRLLRESLVRILRKRSDISVVGAEPFSPATLEQVAESSPQVLLFHSLSGETCDLEFIQKARRALPEIKVVLVGMACDEKIFLCAVRSGAVGYVLQEAGAMDVVNAVRSVCQDEAVCPPRLCRTLFDSVAHQPHQQPAYAIRRERRRSGLSRREQQLVPFLAQGFTNKEIAARLNLSEQTVKNHIHRMLQKMGAPDREAIVELCSVSGLRP
jgi:DNA-binding NarL/FixJ family response regulator